jgi:hypothetical protein
VDGQPAEIKGVWQVRFISGGPALPAPYAAPALGSWTTRDDAEAKRFAGTACYTTTFDAPAATEAGCLLDLGRVCESARIRLNGRDLGTLIVAPYRVATPPLKAKDNLLEVEVTNLPANRIRDLDRRGVQWKSFNNVTLTGIDLRPFDAANWELRDSGLLGPVRLFALSGKRP